ncbi:hypothetical protein P7C73_g2185, partial [Tremellales sp. Uapishka_1]
GARFILPPSSASSATSTTPLVLTDISPKSRINHEETFAPCLAVLVGKDTEEMIALANAHETGLSSSIFTADYKEALDIAKRLDTGAVHINAMTVHDQHVLPHGGQKASGWGRYNAKGAIEAFTQTKNITMQNPHHLPLEAL